MSLVRRAVQVRTKYGVVNQMRMVRADSSAAGNGGRKRPASQNKVQWGKLGVVVGGAASGAVLGAFGAKVVGHATTAAVGRTARGIGHYAGSSTLHGLGKLAGRSARAYGAGSVMFGAIQGALHGATAAVHYVTQTPSERRRAATASALAGARSIGARVAGGAIGSSLGLMAGTAIGHAAVDREIGGMVGSVIGGLAGARVGARYERATLATAGILVGGNAVQAMGARVPNIYRGVRSHFTRQPTRATTIPFGSGRLLGSGR